MANNDFDFPNTGAAIPADLARTHARVQITPSFMPFAEYSILLPKSWHRKEDLGAQESDPGKLVTIGLFYQRNSPEAAAVQVFCCSLSCEVSLRDWIEYQATLFGTRLTYCREVQTPAGAAVDAGGIFESPKQQNVTRLFARTDQGRIYFVVAQASSNVYPSVKNDLAIAATSFRLLKPSGPQMEHWAAASGTNPDFIAAYPASWSYRALPAKIPNKSGVDIYLAIDGQMEAYVRVKAIRPEAVGNVDSLPSTAAEELRGFGFNIASGWQTDGDPVVSAVSDIMFAKIATGQKNGQTAELRFACVKRTGLVFAITAILVPKDKDPLLWMRSKRAYQIALATAASGK